MALCSATNVKRMILLQNWTSGVFWYDLTLFRACWGKFDWLKCDQLYITWCCSVSRLVEPALHYSAARKCTVSRCCIVIRRRNREAFQVMTVLVLKQFQCLQHEKTRLWRSGVTRATLTSHYQTTAALYRYCIIPCSPSGQSRLEASLQVGIGVGTILIHLDPITPSVLGPFDVA